MDTLLRSILHGSDPDLREEKIGVAVRGIG